MDVAKYLLTAILLSSAFSGISDSVWINILVILSVLITLGIGLWLVSDKK